MPIFRWEHNWNPVHDLEREFDRLLNSVNLTIQGVRLGRQYPLLNLYELEDDFLLTAEIPGTQADDLDLTVANGVLTLRGERKNPAGIPDEKFRRQERFRGNWQRAVTLPERIQEDKLTAQFNNGLLTIRLPKVNEIKPRQIPVIEGGGE